MREVGRASKPEEQLLVNCYFGTITAGVIQLWIYAEVVGEPISNHFFG
jgi:hypothetical protein